MKYLGESKLESLAGTPYEKFTKTDWAMEYIGRYGQIDGEHHKEWVLDQVARILRGTKVQVKLAKWDDGTVNYRIQTKKPSKAYLAWVEEMKYDEDSEEYDYEEGIGP